MSFPGLLGFLSRLPFRSEPPAEIARWVAWIPVAGLVLGALEGSGALLLWYILPPWIAAVGILGVYLAVHGILHLDGLSDVADAWASGGGTPEARRRVLKDPHAGTAGILAVALSILVFYETVQHGVWQGVRVVGLVPVDAAIRIPGVTLLFAFVVAETCAGMGMVALAYFGSPMEGSVLARPFVEGARGKELAIALVMSLAVTFLLGGALVLLVPAAVAVAWALHRSLGRTLGGVNGDGLGTVQVLVFLASLVVAAVVPWWPPGLRGPFP